MEPTRKKNKNFHPCPDEKEDTSRAPQQCRDRRQGSRVSFGPSGHRRASPQSSPHLFQYDDDDEQQRRRSPSPYRRNNRGRSPERYPPHNPGIATTGKRCKQNTTLNPRRFFSRM